MPQGGIVSPILANIYLDKLDKYVKEYIRHFDMGTKRRPAKETTIWPMNENGLCGN